MFNDITSEQWAWYYQMIAQDEKEELELTMDYIEYLASFWNAEAVRKIKGARIKPEDQGFASDEEFEKQILSGSFKDDDIVKEIRNKYKNTNLNNSDMTSKQRSRRLPKDLAGIRDLFGDDK